MKELKLGELFCGPGWISLGAEMANHGLATNLKTTIKHAWAVDYHRSTVDTFIKNITGASKESVLCADVGAKVVFESILKSLEGIEYSFVEVNLQI